MEAANDEATAIHSTPSSIATNGDNNNSSSVVDTKTNLEETGDGIYGIFIRKNLVFKKADCDETLNEDGSPVHNTASSLLSPSAVTLPCEMCHNYETNLTKLQDSERNLKEQLAAAQHLADRYQTELSGERLYRNELESKMSSVCSDTEKEARLAMDGNQKTSEALENLEKKYERLKQEQSRKVHLLKDRLREINDQMVKLNQRYLNLLGTNRKCAAEMQAQAIELPSDVDQLQFVCLQLKEELIETRAAREHMERALCDEITTLKEQRREDELEKKRLEAALTEQVNGVSQQLGLARSELVTLQDASHKMEEMDKRIVEYQNVIEDLEKQVKSTHKERIDLEMTLNAYKQKCTALQQELDTSETVQKDFVKLSQNLQIELEKIRQAEQEVRWQFNEDVHMCNQCHTNFTKNASKLHCQHCGKIFCAQCLNCKVPAGAHGRLAKVCKVCHTLLIRDSAPFFSQSDEQPP
ncbi:unnamed protein product [Anisakis simplex]|uniref:FYVE-type domain-containing protein n=1 Tax=Anisakis simplex TaxID=6269 RepID=A0A0M3K1V9_ANISI|nr:unnamed protein product [Anisakis simplex]